MGDLWMILIHTRELNQVNPFDYLTEPAHHQRRDPANGRRPLPRCFLGSEDFFTG